MMLETKKLLFCLFASLFFLVYCWFLFLMLFKLFYFCGEFEWVSNLLREGKEEKLLRCFFLKAFVMRCSCLRGCFVPMNSHWFYLTAGWNQMGWNILFKPGLVRAGCSNRDLSSLYCLSGQSGLLLSTHMV